MASLTLKAVNPESLEIPHGPVDRLGSLPESWLKAGKFISSPAYINCPVPFETEMERKSCPFDPGIRLVLWTRPSSSEGKETVIPFEGRKFQRIPHPGGRTKTSAASWLKNFWNISSQAIWARRTSWLNRFWRSIRVFPLDWIPWTYQGAIRSECQWITVRINWGFESTWLLI